jgi:ATP-binding cassette subfamily B protein
VPWRQKHFVVVHKTTKDKIYVADPAKGLLEYDYQDFLDAWTTAQDKTGFVMLFEPNPNFFKLKEDKTKIKSFGFLWSYLKPYKKLINQLLIGFMIGIIIQFFVPFLI